MKWTLVLLAAATAFLTGVISVTDHAALVKAGYEVSELERLKEDLETASAHSRARLGYLSSPEALVARAQAFGLVTDYPREHAVQMVAPVAPNDGALTARGE